MTTGNFDFCEIWALSNFILEIRMLHAFLAYSLIQGSYLHDIINNFFFFHRDILKAPSHGCISPLDIFTFRQIRNKWRTCRYVLNGTGIGKMSAIFIQRPQISLENMVSARFVKWWNEIKLFGLMESLVLGHPTTEWCTFMQLGWALSPLTQPDPERSFAIL